MTRDHDHRDIHTALLRDRERLRPVEGREVVIRKDDLGLKFRDALLEISAGQHAARDELDPSLPEFTLDQFRIEFRVLEGQDAQAGVFGRAHGVRTGASFSTSQYRPKLLIASEKFSNSTGFTM